MQAEPLMNFAVPVVADGALLHFVVPPPWFVLPAMAREFFRRKVAANDEVAPADEPPAAA